MTRSPLAKVDGALPIGLGRSPPAVGRRQAAAVQPERGGKDLAAGQHHAAGVEAQPAAEDVLLGLAVGLDQRRDGREGALQVVGAQALDVDRGDREVGEAVLAHGVDLADQPSVVGGVEAAIDEDIADRILVEDQLVGRALGGEAPEPMRVELEDAAAQDVGARRCPGRTWRRRR